MWAGSPGAGLPALATKMYQLNWASCISSGNPIPWNYAEAVRGPGSPFPVLCGKDRLLFTPYWGGEKNSLSCSWQGNQKLRMRSSIFCVSLYVLSKEITGMWRRKAHKIEEEMSQLWWCLETNGPGKVRRVKGGTAWSAVGLGSRKENRRHAMLWPESPPKQEEAKWPLQNSHTSFS